MLTIQAVLPFLTDRGLLSPDDLVTGHPRVFDRSRRNQNFEVDCEGCGYFIKQGSQHDGFSGVGREAEVYALLASSRKFVHMPELVLYDESSDVLVLRLVRDAEDLRAMETRRRVSSIRIARGIGRALARLHTIHLTDHAKALLGSGSPGVLAAHRPGLVLLRDFSAASIELIRLIQSDLDLITHLELLRSTWTADTLIHHDLRLENILLTPRPLLIDWETSALGDPAWDLGCIVGDYLGLWLMSIPSSAEHPPADSLRLAARPLSSVQPAISNLLSSYASAVKRHARSGLARPAGPHNFSVRVSQYAAVKLIQLAIEQVQSRPTWTSTSLAHLQVAANMLNRPEQGLTVLLGIERTAA